VEDEEGIFLMKKERETNGGILPSWDYQKQGSEEPEIKTGGKNQPHDTGQKKEKSMR